MHMFACCMAKKKKNYISVCPKKFISYLESAFNIKSPQKFERPELKN